MKENVPWMPGLYVSVDGDIFELRNNNWVQLRIYHSLSKNHKYRRAYFYFRGGIRSVSRLVAKVHIPNKYNKPYVGHKDNNRENNKVENLYWCTNQENTQQCIRDGRFNIPSPKLSEESINKMIEDYESGMSNLQIKVKYGISIMTMYKYFSERGVIWKKGKR